MMNEIIYLIKQADKYLQEENYELASMYNLDAWISLKEYMVEKDILSKDELYFKTKHETETVKKWLNNFFLACVDEHQFKVNIEIISGMLAYLELNKDDLIVLQRELAESYFNIKDYATGDELYKKYIKDNPDILEYYYGYALTLLFRNEKIQAINILEEGIEHGKKDDNFIEPAFEVLIDTYESLNEYENANVARNKLKTFKQSA